MRGSGVDSLDYEREFSCEDCDAETTVGFSLEGNTGEVEWTCEKCKSTHTSEVDIENDGIDPDANFDD